MAARGAKHDGGVLRGREYPNSMLVIIRISAGNEGAARDLDENFKGSSDEVAVYDRALTATQVARHAASSAAL